MSVARGHILDPKLSEAAPHLPESPVGSCCGPAPWQSPSGIASTCPVPGWRRPLWLCRSNVACGGDPHVWQCDDGRCVSSSWRCDGAADCLDGSDEQDCGCECCSVPSVCGAKKVQCPGTHHCIPHWELCDRHQDCEDGWDEEGCPQEPCLPGQWQCRNRVCIMAEWKCNGIDNCGDSSDEDVCGKQACWMLLSGVRPCALRCDAATRCIPESWLCDSHADCLDHTDEQGCGETLGLDGTGASGVPKECSRAEFPCRSGQCVALALRCDGDHDCRDGSDEEGCTVPRPLLCRMGEVACPHSRECVLEAWRCDGATDCGDGTDEQSHEYPCGLRACLNASLVCDGQQDCADGSDEGGNCSVPCQRSCTHLCYPSPQGPVSASSPGPGAYPAMLPWSSCRREPHVSPRQDPDSPFPHSGAGVTRAIGWPRTVCPAWT
uniref:Uncharacterized protein n=1 Tax=Accipiter nisus TaxID=211598 RepID=A0A8B9LZ68_9AVES